MLSTAGTVASFDCMTASWGIIGHIWQRRVPFVMFRPQRYALEFIERNPTITISFFPPEFQDALGLLGTKSGRDCDKVAEAGLTPFETRLGAA
jgi:flavin reductase (DIM6/NTAB) family NADH-FMN oxidoreductase RutF